MGNLWHTLQKQQPRRNSRVLLQYVDGYGNFCDYDVASYTRVGHGVDCTLNTHGTTLFYNKVKRWMQISDIDKELWHTADEKPTEGAFVLAEIYRELCGSVTETTYIVLQRRQLSCPKFTGIGYVRYNLYHEDERVVRWCYIKDLAK